MSIVKYLIESGANVHAKNDTALCQAAVGVLVKRANLTHNRHLSVVKYLVECAGADIHAQDDIALRLSACHGRLAVVKYLVGRGANIHARDNYALGMSAGNGHLDVVQFLIGSGANIYADDDYAQCSNILNRDIRVLLKK